MAVLEELFGGGSCDGSCVDYALPVTNAAGAPCKPGETAARTGCVPRREVGPSKPKDRRDVAPEPQPYTPPPPKEPRAGPFVRPVGDESQTKCGDEAEAAALKLGFRSILPPGKRSFTAAETAKGVSSIDLEYDHSGKLYELKMCSTEATEYRLKAKKEEKDGKLEYAKRKRAEVYTMVAVRDADSGDIHFYGSKEPGLTGAEVSDAAFDYYGTVKHGR